MYSFPSFESNDFIFSRNLISPYEYFFLLLYIIIFLTIGVIIRNSYYKNHQGRKYFLPALLLKIIGGVVICLIYNYYYVGGDTNAYFNDARLLNKILFHDPLTAMKLFFSGQDKLLNDFGYYYNSFRFLRADDTFMVVRIAAFLQIFTFNSFLVTSALFGFLSFFCLWYFYVALCKLYPMLYGKFAYATMFVPSLVIWGSGIFKDTICLALLCLIYGNIQNSIREKKIKFWNSLIIITAIYLLIVIKAYIVLIFSLSFSTFFILGTLKKMKNIFLKYALAPIIISIGLVGFYYTFEKVGKTSKSEIYSIEKILKTAEITGNYLQYVSSLTKSSGYSLGEIEYTVAGIIKKAPQAINVTLFRPYLWEVRKPIMLFSAFESFSILLFTVFIFLKNGIFRSLKIALNNVLIFSFLIYSIVFAFSIGITSFNFGSLVRYKIPILPFYLIALILIDYYSNISKRKKSGVSYPI